MSALPVGWATTSIADIALFNPKTVAEDSLNAGFAPMQMLGTRFRDRMVFEERPWGEIKKAYVHFQPGDVIVAKVTPCFENGKAGIAPTLPNGIGAGSSEFCVLRPAQGIDERYLLAWLSTEDFRRRATVAMTGSVGLKRVPKEVFLSERIPLAPKAEQERIADKLDAVLTRVDAVNTRLARVAPILKRFRQSVLAAATSGQLTEDWRRSNADGAVLSQCLQRNNRSDGLNPPPSPDSTSLNIPATWRVLRAQDVVETDANIVYGIVQPGPKLVSGIPYVQTTDIVDGQIQVGSLCRTSVDIADKYRRSSIKGGDVLLGIIRATKVAVVPDELSGGNISRSVARLRPCRDMVPQFLAIALESPAVQDWLHAQHRGMDMPVLNLAQVRLAPLPVAPIDEQREIVRRVETLFAFADRLEARLQTAQKASERLTAALLAKAFRGELVPQDPNDEPASELLRRLHSDAQASGTKRIQRRTA